MKIERKQRALYVYQYLQEHTDEEHPATIKDIIEYLSGLGLKADRKTVSRDIEALLECGFDIIKTRSTQNQYFIGARVLELAELKMLVDAVQAARFISSGKANDLIQRLTSLASPHQAGELNRALHVNGRATDSNVLATVDMLYRAVQTQQTISFCYSEYSPEKLKVYRHNGQLYELSPYDLFWSNDRYYVLGYSKTHAGIATFRVDRIEAPELTGRAANPKPPDYSIEDYRDGVFLMYDGPRQTVELLCDNKLMNAIVDKFGNEVETAVADSEHFVVTVEMATGPTFFAWVFNYAGRIRILYPQSVVKAYQAHFRAAEQALE